MILSIVRTGFLNLRRDRGALMLSFVVPIAFFSIFAGIFGSRGGGLNPVSVAVVDEDRSEVSQRLVKALEDESGLRAAAAPEAAKGAAPVPYDSRSAEAAVHAGDVSVAVVIPKGFGNSPTGFSGPGGARLRLLTDSSDPVAAQVVFGLIQKAAIQSMPDLLTSEEMRMLDRLSGGLTPGQRARIDSTVVRLREYVARRGTRPIAGTKSEIEPLSGGLISAEIRDVVGENKKNPLVAFYAAGIGVMFLLFSASAAGGAILDESESGTLDRILSSRVTMTNLLLGKWVYAALLGFTQLTVMFLWGAFAFQVELFKHLDGFLIMATATVLASSGLGLLLATSCKTRAQLGALTTLVVLVMSALGGSMVPRFIMPESLQKVGLVTFNAWAIDGFTKVFWREEPVSHLWPQVLVLVGAAALFFAIARRLARRWEVA
ncbi:MAG TPA: ABC transporter permease [Candidatus Dormibacteraeota bacterium]|nr:ABC transporter permease [Candidatus Dormibacteraeota bacterium]